MHTINANGANIPSIGLGTWTLKGSDCTDIVQAAIETGYRHIDTAAMYDNEDDVGLGIARSGAPRNDLFVTTKVWHSDLAAADLRRSAERSLERLGLEYVDLLLIHWPNPAIPLAESIDALNAARDDGLARNIGVSNFPTALLAQAISLTKHPLAVNQVEYHPKLDQTKVLGACRAAGMATVSYCPLGRGLGARAGDCGRSEIARPNAGPGHPAVARPARERGCYSAHLATGTAFRKPRYR